MRSPLALSVLVLFGVLAMPGEGRAATPANAGDNCTTLGATQWAADNTGLLGCGLVTANTAPPANVCATPGMCKWKAMSGGSEGPQGSFCGFLTCRVWPCSGGPIWPDMVQTSCDLSGVLEHIPCNGHSLVITGTCTGSTASTTVPVTASLSERIGEYFPIMSCPSGYSKKRMSFFPTLAENPYQGTARSFYFTCVKN